MPIRSCRPSSEDTITHEVDLPVLCPHSKNPLSGSTLELSYSPSVGLVLDVDDLAEEVERYKGGHPSGVRDMETTIQDLCAFAARSVNTSVTACASLLISTKLKTVQRLTIRCKRDCANRDQ